MKPLTVLAVPLVLAAAGAAGGILYLQSEGVTPRALAPYILKRTSGHNDLIEEAGRLASASLLRLDRGEERPYALPALTFLSPATIRSATSTPTSRSTARAAASPTTA